MNELKDIQKWIQDERDKCVRFWLNYGFDSEHGGMYTCLTRDGSLYSTDKSVWMQGRCAWTYAYLCNIYGLNDEWLRTSKSCLDFLEQYCKNPQAANRMYFTVTGDGKPLRQRRYNFSEAFYVMGNAEYYGITGEKQYLERALEAYQLVYDLNHGMPDPTGLGPKTIPSTRSGRSLANPMIFLNTTSILRRVAPEHSELFDRYERECLEEIQYHIKDDMACTLETVGLNGEFQRESTAGRVINPGHDIECAWFLLEIAKRNKDEALIELVEKMYQYAMNTGWDKEYGGLLYFVDCLGYPPESYEHDMKLWWPHTEAMIASISLYEITKKKSYVEDFLKVIDYCKTHFSDPEYGEWFGYLRRDGKPTEPPSKGSSFKGPFHLPRALIMVDKVLERLLNQENK